MDCSLLSQFRPLPLIIEEENDQVQLVHLELIRVNQTKKSIESKKKYRRNVHCSLVHNRQCHSNHSLNLLSSSMYRAERKTFSAMKPRKIFKNTCEYFFLMIILARPTSASTRSRLNSDSSTTSSRSKPPSATSSTRTVGPTSSGNS